MDEVPDVAENYEEDDDTDYFDKILKSSNQSRTAFTTVAAVSMRNGASNRMTAAIATATMIDLGLGTAEDRSKVLDHNKVARVNGRRRLIQSTGKQMTSPATASFFMGERITPE